MAVAGNDSDGQDREGLEPEGQNGGGRDPLSNERRLFHARVGCGTRAFGGVHACVRHPASTFTHRSR